jgi:hypothetical protein
MMKQLSNIEQQNHLGNIQENEKSGKELFPNEKREYDFFGRARQFREIVLHKD